MKVEIPSDRVIAGPYNEIGCTISDQNGMGSLARGVKQLGPPR